MLAIISLFLLGALAVIRYLAIDPGFQIKTRAAGNLAMWLAIGPRDIVYGDIDHLGKINDALTIGEQSGHDRFNELMRLALRQLRRADIALVYGGDEIRFIVAPRSAHGFCRRLQEILHRLPYTQAERAALQAATGRPYITITLAYEPSNGVLTHKPALMRAKQRVSLAKPKGSNGQRGQIVIEHFQERA